MTPSRSSADSADDGNYLCSSSFEERHLAKLISARISPVRRLNDSFASRCEWRWQQLLGRKKSWLRFGLETNTTWGSITLHTQMVALLPVVCLTQKRIFFLFLDYSQSALLFPCNSSYGAARIFSYHLIMPRPAFKPMSFKLKRPCGTFWWTLYRLIYRAKGHFQNGISAAGF